MLLEAPARAASKNKKRWPLLFLIALVLVLFVPPRITISRFQKRLEAAMTAAVGRQVTVQQVHPRLLPQPGFDLEGFAIHDDPALSSEPLVRADAVTADLRLLSLWRGRVEISKLSLHDPSLNLVRGNDGHWNLEALLVHAAQVPTAPTTKRTSEARPRFPYIEADNGRINFKVGEEKKVYAFTEADFALWLAGENEWQMRLKARPIRTDEDLGDTGTLRLSGSLERAISSAPLHLNFDWENAQLGQLTQLLYERDRGWRGGVAAEGTISGSPQLLNISGNLSVKDFRRYDIASSDSLNVGIHCDGMYRRGPDEFEEDLRMRLPVLRANCAWSQSNGLLNATLNDSLSDHRAELRVTAAAFPMSELAALARHMKRGLAPDLTATGALNGTLLITRGYPAVAADGAGSSTLTASAQLRSAALTSPLDLGVMVLNFQQAPAIAAPGVKTHSKKNPKPVNGFFLTLLPIKVPLGGAAPLVASGSADAAGYDLQLQGEAGNEQLQQALLALGFSAPNIDPAAGVKSKVDLHIQGAWAGFPAPETLGSVHPEAPTALARGKLQ